MSAAYCWTCSQPIARPENAVLTWDERLRPGLFRIAHQGDCFAMLDATDRLAYTVSLKHHAELFAVLLGLNARAGL